MYRPTEHFEAGVRVDPQAESELFRWALSQPRLDLEETPVAPVALAAPDCDPEPYDIRRELDWDLAIEDEHREGLYR